MRALTSIALLAKSSIKESRVTCFLRVHQFLNSLAIFLLALIAMPRTVFPLDEHTNASLFVRSISFAYHVMLILNHRKATLDLLIIMFPIPFYLVMMLSNNEESAESIIQNSLQDIAGAWSCDSDNCDGANYGPLRPEEVMELISIECAGD